jgi:O-antigen/teichoic acid export membrane protein
MRNDGTIKKISFVAFSNIIKLISSILVAFVIPNILGLTNYGYYKVFILYLTYLGLFHFGFIDGIYLKYGGIDYDKLDKKSFRTYFKFLIRLEFIISIIGIVITILFVEGEKKIIFLLLFLNLIALNLTTYYQFISQITSRFREYSTRLIILSVTNIIIVALLYIFKIYDYRIYIGLIVSVNYLLLLWYIYTYRDITFGSSNKLSEHKNEIMYYFKTGIPLLLANLSTIFVITVDKQIVEILFPVEVFGVYSFAYSMLSMITVVVSAVGIVLYPTLKKTSINNIAKNYSNLNRIIILVVITGLAGYFPLLWIIPRFLPDYVGSLDVFRVALPGLVLTSSISAIKHNFFKITDKNISFFIIGLIAIIVNIILNLGAYHFFGTTISIAISSVIGISIWYVTTEIYMVRKYQIFWKSNALLAITGISYFYLVTFINNFIISGIAYIMFLIILIIFNFKKILIIAKT